MLDEQVVQYDYVHFLIDNLTRLRKGVKVELTVASVTLSEPIDGPLRTFHFAVFVKARGDVYRDVVFQGNYLTPNSTKIKKPYVEYDNIRTFLKFLDEVFDPANVRNILRKIQMVKKSQLLEEELDIEKKYYWNH